MNIYPVTLVKHNTMSTFVDKFVDTKSDKPFYNHPNNVILREWCSAQRGRAAMLGRMMFPADTYTENARRTMINVYKHGKAPISLVQMQLILRYMSAVQVD